MTNLNKYADYLRKSDDSAEYWAEGAILEFTEKLARIMEEMGVSRSELADRLGTSKSYITKVFSGQANFTVETMAKVAHAVDRELRIHLAPMNHSTDYIDRPLSDVAEIVVDLSSRRVDVEDRVVDAMPRQQWVAWTIKARDVA